MCVCVMEDESGEQVKDELETMTSSAESFMQCKADRMKHEVDSRDEVIRGEMSNW